MPQKLRSQGPLNLTFDKIEERNRTTPAKRIMAITEVASTKVNPFHQTINLNNEAGRKIFNIATKGLLAE